jgi:VanZ family protein
MALIFYLSSQSNLPNFQDYELPVKKGAHLMVYALLYFLLFRAFHARNQVRGHSLSRTYAYPALISLLYAISDEIHQSFVPFRTASFRDVIIDCVGIFLMYLALRRDIPFFGRFLRKPGA